jgi:CHAT domain-containing protein
MAAWRCFLVIVLPVCLLNMGDRAPASREVAYYQSVQWFNHAEFENARQAAEAGYRTWCGRPQARDCWLLRLAWAEALIELDRIQDAFPLLETAAPSPEGEARRLSDLAMAHLRSKQNEAALQCLEKARAAVPSTARDLMGKIELIGGMLQMNSGQMAEAEVSFRRALGAVEGSRSLIESYTLGDLGFVDLRRFRYDEARYWSGRARDTAQQNNMRRPLVLAMGNLGASFLYLGDLDRAIKNLGDAAALAEELHDRVYEVRMLVVLGEAWLDRGDLTKAEECGRKALSMVNSERDKEWVADALDDLSQIALKKGDIASAEELNVQGTALAKEVTDPSFVLPHTIQSAAIAAARREYPEAERGYKLALIASRNAKDPVATFRCHAGLASLYRETGAASNAELEYRAATNLSDEERAKLREDDSKFSFVSSLIEFYRHYVDFLEDRGDHTGAFRVAESCRARVLEEKLHRDSKDNAAVDIKSLEREAHASGTIFLSYWLAPQRSLLWVIDSSGLHPFPLPPEEEIASQVRRYNAAIQRGENTVETGNEAGRWLFANLLGAHYRVPRNSKVVIEPDGVLHQLNFESLPSGGGGRYWIEDATVSIAPSLGLLRRSETIPARRLLAFGDPGYDGTEFERLPDVKAELDAVEKHFAEKDVYVSSAATPAAYRRSHPESYSTLHFASHAVANRESPLDSAIVLAGPAESRKLYAREILQQPLTAELVTLSACQTAGSRTYYGEGLTGFSWAFLSAGARNVVAGLWDVDDHATASLMKNFYDELSSGLSPVSALRRAKLDFMALGGVNRKPRYWAAFETFTKALYR